MEVRPHRIIHRRKTRKIKLGNVSVGADSVISVQSMTNTLTTNVSDTIKQINQFQFQIQIINIEIVYINFERINKYEVIPSPPRPKAS